jgi:hypothetical protein
MPSRPPHRRRPPLTLADRLVSAVFGAVAGTVVAVLFALFGFRGPAVGAGLGLLPFIGWFAAGFALIGLLFGAWIGELLGVLVGAIFEPDGNPGQGETLAPVWLVVLAAVALVVFLVWWGLA